MQWNRHYNLPADHAFLSASKYHWLNYDDEKLIDTYNNFLAVQRGTELHAFAAEAIRLGIKMPKNHQTLNQYINDAIGYRLTPEQLLYYSDNCYGTADGISFEKDFLRIHDLKTGVTPAHMEQLEIYAALFCLEYGVRPGDIDMELRIYQCNDILIHKPTAEDIGPIMDKIIHYDKLISGVKEE